MNFPEFFNLTVITQASSVFWKLQMLINSERSFLIALLFLRFLGSLLYSNSIQQGKRKMYTSSDGKKVELGCELVRKGKTDGFIMRE